MRRRRKTRRRSARGSSSSPMTRRRRHRRVPRPCRRPRAGRFAATSGFVSSSNEIDEDQNFARLDATYETDLSNALTVEVSTGGWYERAEPRRGLHLPREPDCLGQRAVRDLRGHPRRSWDRPSSTPGPAGRRADLVHARGYERIEARNPGVEPRPQGHDPRGRRSARRRPPGADLDRVDQRSVHGEHAIRRARDLPRGLSVLRSPRQSGAGRGHRAAAARHVLQRPATRNQSTGRSRDGACGSARRAEHPGSRERRHRRDEAAALRSGSPTGRSKA